MTKYTWPILAALELHAASVINIAPALPPWHALTNAWHFIPPQWSNISSRRSEVSRTWRSKPWAPITPSASPWSSEHPRWPAFSSTTVRTARRTSSLWLWSTAGWSSGERGHAGPRGCSLRLQRSAATQLIDANRGTLKNDVADY